MKAADGGGTPPMSPCAQEHPILLALLLDALGPGDVFVDVGANTGFFALPIAKHVGREGRVLAFEPAPDVARRLRSAASEGGADGPITVHEVALGNEHGSTTLRADPEYPDDTTKRSLFIANGPAVAEVPVRSFDELVSSGDVVVERGIDAVKIDVEGAEMLVLEGMRRTLQRHRPRLVVIETIESHLRRTDSSVADVHAFMRKLGYTTLDDEGRLRLNAAFVPRRAS